MDDFFNFALIGLGTGAMYALTALGVVAVHRGSNTLNLATGGVAVWAALLYERLTSSRGWSVWPTFLFVVALGALFGVAVYGLVLRPIRHRTHVTRMVGTLGVYTALIGLADHVFSDHPLNVPSQFPLDPVEIPLIGQSTGRNRLILLAIAVAAAALLSLWSSRSRLALATRAMADHERAAQALGASPHVLGAVSWALGCALAAAAGMLVAPIVGLNDMALAAVAIFALAAALLGGFNSYGLALGGGILIGVGQSLTTHYAHVVLPSGHEAGWDKAVPFIFVMVLLVARRSKESNRLAAVDAPPVAAARIRPAPVVLAIGAVLVFISQASTKWLDASIVTFGYGMLALSVVVLVGYANQISLAQMAIAGLGGFAAARCSVDFGVPFTVLPVVGAAAGAAAGFVVGLPSLRVRGVNLAVATLAMGLAVSEVLFQNFKYTGGDSGLRPEPPRFFGVPVDAAFHTRGYALLSFGWLLLAIGAVVWVRRSKLGRQLLAVRTNERAAGALGVSVARSKLAAFVISSAIAGCAGVLLSFRFSSVTFQAFTFNDSINLVVVTVVTGIGSVIGGIAAGILAVDGLIFTAIRELDIAFLQENYETVFGIGLILTVLLHPNGMTWRSRMAHDDTGIEDGEAAGSDPMELRAADIEVSFGGVRSVRGAGFHARPAQVLGVVGPNGAGKSTLLDAISGFVTLDRGSIELGGQAISGSPVHRRARAGVGRVFQGLDLFEDMTVAQNLRIAAENAGGTDGSLPPACRRALDRFGLSDSLDRFPTELSLAQRKFVGIARALASNPTVLLLDEPGAGLSLTDIETLGAELRALAREEGLPVVVVDHNMGLVMSTCDLIVVLQLGEVLVVGTPDEVSEDEAVRSAYLGDSHAPLEDAQLDIVALGHER